MLLSCLPRFFFFFFLRSHGCIFAYERRSTEVGGGGGGLTRIWAGYDGEGSPLITRFSLWWPAFLAVPCRDQRGWGGDGVKPCRGRTEGKDGQREGRQGRHEGDDPLLIV